MRTIGSQTRETLEEAGYKLYGWCPNGVILEDEDGKLELWALRNDCASYVVEVDGKGYEFVSDWYPGVEQTS